MTLKTSLVISGDSSGAQKAVDDLNVSLTRVGEATRAAAQPMVELDKAQADIAASARDGGVAAAELIEAQRKGATGARDLAQSLDAGAAAQAGVTSGAREASTAMQELVDVQGGVASSAGAAADAVKQEGEAQTQAATTARDLAKAVDTTKQSQAAQATVAREAASAQMAYNSAVVEAASGGQALATVSQGLTEGTAGIAKVQESVAVASDAAGASFAQQCTAAQGLGEEFTALLASTLEGNMSMQAFADSGGTLVNVLAEMGKGLKAAGSTGEQAGTHLGGLGTTVEGVAGNVADASGNFASAAALLEGPWGAAILAATNILGGFALGLIEGAHQQEATARGGLELVDALQKQSFATKAAQDAIEDYNQQAEKKRKNDTLATDDAVKLAKVRLADAAAIRQQTQALLEQAKVQLERAISDKVIDSPGFNPEGGALSAALAGGRVGELQRQMDANQAQISLAAQTARNAQADLATLAAKAAVDPIERINQLYDRRADAARRAAAANDGLTASLAKTLTQIERNRKADTDTEQDRQRRANDKPNKGRAVSIGGQVESDQAAQLLRAAQGYTGLSENRAGDRGQLETLFAKASVNIDPRMVAWCAAFVNSVLATDGLKGTGSLSARSFLDYGEATAKPNKGDIVVSKRGDNAAQGHVGFYQGTDARGRVLVLGGNTGDRVGTQAVDRRDVLGFRRAPSAADQFADQTKTAADALKQQAQDLVQVTAKYLPAVQAAKDYADELERIDRLAKSYDPAKAGSGLSADQAAQAREAVTAARDKRLADLALTPEAKAADDARKSLDGVVASLGRETAARQALDPVQRAMIENQADLAKLSDVERTAYENKLQSLYAQDEAYRAIEDATRAAAQAQEQFRSLTLDALDAVVVRGEKAGDVVKHLAQTIASAALEATVLGTGPLAALLRGGGASVAAGSAIAPAGSFGSLYGQVSGSGSQAVADVLGKTVSKSIGDRLDGTLGKGGTAKALQYGGYGYIAANASGGSGIGGSIGGAIGGEIASKAFAGALGSLGGLAGPLGSIAGGLLGGVVGKLFAGKPKEYGSSTISFGNGAASAGASIGQGNTEREKASALGGSVADGLNRIAEQLGGEIGSASVSIGYRPGHKAGAYRVDPTGGGAVTNGSVQAFATEAEAIAYAIRDAIADGGVKGLSDAVQKALQSSTDVDKALAEATKVQGLETLMGGVQAEIAKAFSDFETTARERVRIAKEYGFDLVAIEKRNGEDRAKVAAQLLKTQVGSLQSLIDEMTQGSLFDGNALEKIAAINQAITKAQADLDAGVDGAGDTLANLLSQRLAASKDAYASTDGYAADRTATLDQARAAVAKANAQIAAAQAKSDPALATTNAALDENNDQNAQMLAALETNNALLAQIVGASGGSGRSAFDLTSLAQV